MDARLTKSGWFDTRMGSSEVAAPAPRMWPAWLLLGSQATMLALTTIPPLGNVARFGFLMGGPLVCLALFVVWVVFVSGMSRRQRWSIVGAILGWLAVAVLVVDPSVRVAVWTYGVPFVMATVAGGLTVGRAWPTRRWFHWVVSGLVVGLGLAAAIRIEGFTGTFVPEVVPRWATVDLAVEAGDSSLLVAPVANAGGRAEWPGFRGPARDGRMRDVLPALDWSSQQPQEVWRIPVGHAWSSFALSAGRLFTQEQRGDHETVTAYRAATGEMIWQQGDRTRFAEVVSGTGPRATPTVDGSRVYALGANGLLSALAVADGSLLWQRDFVADLAAEPPLWGFSSSPLVVDGRVVVYAGAADNRGLVAFDAITGAVVWGVPSQGWNFSSAQTAVFGDETVVLFADRAGLLAMDPRTGAVIWRFTPTRWAGPPIAQVQQIGPTSLIVPVGDSAGLARLEVVKTRDGWVVEERWSSRALKPSFNDFVVREGFIYGFDRNILACVDVETGERRWKRGRYGFGQLLLLEGASQLLVISEQGDAVVVAADPTQHQELGRIRVLNGKTWNHPVVSQGRLFVRNGREAVRLDLASDTEPVVHAAP